MSKQITSPVSRWAGTVTISDPLTLPQVQLIEAGSQKPERREGEKTFWLSEIDELKLPAVLACVEKWELENFTADPFPASPRADSHILIDFIFTALVGVYLGEATIPKE